MAAMLATLVVGALVASAAVAQDDLPGRVGRLADVAGRVYLATQERAEDWLDAFRNDTVTTGDNLWVSGDGRAEIDYGGGQLRLAGDTNVHIARLDDAILALFVAQGRVIFRIRFLEPGDVARVDTPNTQIALTRPGLYRVDVSPDRTRTELVVREGEATASFATGVQQVLPGQTALLEGEAPPYADVRNGYYVDGFDTWSADRDRYYERARSATYVSRQMIGYADLDAYGRWEAVPAYGVLWYPTTVAVDWAPYRYGHWAWVGGWGWTWVDDAPWGYAPFHYGRWVHYGGRWGWAPGGWISRPVWAPAMVAWYGGAGWSFSVSFGAPVYGWVPLAWGEPFVPWWGGCSRRCWTLYNRPYAVNLAERPNAPPVRYTNWSAPGGVTAAAGAVFTGRRPVHENRVDLRPQAIASAPVLSHAPRVDKPAPGKIPGTRPPASAPLPAAAIQTKPMRLPTPAERAAPAFGGVPATRPGASGAARPSGVVPPSGGSAAAPAPAPGVRPPARGRAEPGTWGAAGQPAAGATAAPGTPGRAPAASSPSAAGPSAAPAPSGRAPRSAPPSGYVPPQGSAPLPRSAPPSGYVPPQGSAPVPRSAPPGGYAPPGGRAPAAPGGAPVVPQVAPPPAPASPPPASAAPPGGRRGPPSGNPDAGGAGDAPDRPLPKDQGR